MGNKRTAALDVPQTGEVKQAAMRQKNLPLREKIAEAQAPLEILRKITTAPGAERNFELGRSALLVGQLSLAECKQAVGFFRHLGRNESEILSDLLAKRWAELDPYDALEQAQTNRRNNDWSNRIGFAAGARLVEVDPAFALEKISSATSNDLREKAAEWILPALAQLDARRAAEYLASNPQLTHYRHLYKSVADLFGRSSPEEALAWAREVANEKLREDALGNVWQGFAASNPARAAQALAEEPDLAKLSSAVLTLAGHWSRSDFKATMGWIGSLPNAELKERAYQSIDPERAELSQKEVGELVGALTSERARNDVAAKYASQMAARDIDEALAWAEGLPPKDGRDAAMASVFQHWAGSDPVATTKYILALPEGNHRSAGLNTVFDSWSQSDPASALSYAETMPAGTDRDRALGALVEQARNENADKALALFRSIQNPEISGPLAKEVIGALVESDPAAAVKLAAEVPAAHQPETYRELVRKWASEQPGAAGEWLHTVPAGVARDSAIKAYVSVIDGLDPALATKWAYSIQEPTEQMEATFGAFNRWLGKDQGAAQQWLNETELPEGLRPYFERLLKDEKYGREFR